MLGYPTRKKLSIYYINFIVLTINFHYKFEDILSWGTSRIYKYILLGKKSINAGLLLAHKFSEHFRQP